MTAAATVITTDVTPTKCQKEGTYKPKHDLSGSVSTNCDEKVYALLI